VIETFVRVLKTTGASADFQPGTCSRCGQWQSIELANDRSMIDEVDGRRFNLPSVAQANQTNLVAPDKNEHLDDT